MKSFMLVVALATATLAACGNPQTASAKTNDIEMRHSALNQRFAAAVITPQKESLAEVITQYLHLKNALASDHSKAAVSAAGQLQAALVSLGKQTMNEAEQKAYADISGEVRKNAKQISDNGDNITRQRACFQRLSENIYGLVKAFGTSQTLYKDYCPMARASWLSADKDIKNPYFGKNMSSCGIVKETITQ